MSLFMRAAAAALALSGATLALSGSAEAYRCGQSRPCAGGYNPYNPASYNSPRYYGPRPSRAVDPYAPAPAGTRPIKRQPG